MAGTATAVSVDAEAIRLTDDVAYAYQLDPWAKTLSFTFGSYAGGGCYQFSLDRQTLVIKDGSYSWFAPRWQTTWPGRFRALRPPCRERSLLCRPATT